MTRKNTFPIQMILIFLWLSNLVHTDSYFSVYCLCALGAVCCMSANFRNGLQLSRRVRIGTLVLACFLALAPVLANYPIFEMVRDPAKVSAGANRILNCLEFAATLLGGVPVFYHIAAYMVDKAGKKQDYVPYTGRKPGLFFLLVFGSVMVIDLVYLFFVVYPGNVSGDTVWQLDQVYNHYYNNFSPFWHTQLIRLFTNLGLLLFHDANASIATFNFFQILTMAGTVGYAMMTLYEMQVPKKWLAISFCIYALVPYNIAFSASVWKDVAFSIAMLLMLTAMYRVLRQVGSHSVLDRILVAAGALLLCMARTNGWYSLAVSALIMAICFRKQIRPLLLPLGVVLIVGWIMVSPFFKILGIPTVVKGETLSVPIQQLSRVIVENGNISQGDLDILQNIVHVEEIPELYDPNISDPVKHQVKHNNPQYLDEHGGELLMLWIRNGFKNPSLYLKAWVDQTKGYWNGGYDYYVYAEYVKDNPFGIHLDVSQNLIWQLYKSYFGLTRSSILFQPFTSTGLMVWLTILGFHLCLCHRRRESMLYIPLLVIAAGLWLGTPVFAEFRYIYPLFTAYPLLFPSAIYCREEEGTSEE